MVNIPSFVVRLDSQKHIDFSLKSPFGGGRPGRVKRKNLRKGLCFFSLFKVDLVFILLVFAGAGGGAAAEEEED